MPKGCSVSRESNLQGGAQQFRLHLDVQVTLHAGLQCPGNALRVLPARDHNYRNLAGQFLEQTGHERLNVNSIGAIIGDYQAPGQCYTLARVDAFAEG